MGAGGKSIPGARYKHTAKGRFTAMPSFEDFGSDTNPSSVYKKILDALESAENLLQNHINNTMGVASVELKRVCRHILQRSKKFVEGLFRHMDSTYRELNVSFGDKKETWELVCSCVYEVFDTEFKASRELTEGISFLEPKESGGHFFYAAMEVLSKAEDFMKVGIRNHLSMTAAMVRFVMVMSQKSSVDDTKAQMVEMKLAMETMKSSAANTARLLVEIKKAANDALSKNTSLQSQMDKLKGMARSKGWTV